jgi:hypothetical protein
MNSCPMRRKSPVPHPFASFQANGWEATNSNQSIPEEAQ